MSLKLPTFAALCAVAVALPGWAHHSHGNYELTDFTHLEGTVQEVHLINPHSWIFLEVPGEGEGGPTLWAMEATTPGGLRRNGIERDDVLRATSSACAATSSRTGRTGACSGSSRRCHGDPARGHGIEKEWD